MRAGETLGLVGESGSGKTTLARVLLGLTAPDEGAMLAIEGVRAGRDHTPPDPRAAEDAPDRLPEPRLGAEPPPLGPAPDLPRAVEARRLLGRGADHAAAELIAEVRLVGALTCRCAPAQLSGGLKQRVAIARAFAGDPRIVVCDEPTSALDVSVQAAILNLLTDLQHREQVTYLFISHDLGVVRYLSDRIAVLYLGRLMEIGIGRSGVRGSAPSVHRGAAVGGANARGRRQRERIRLEGEIPSAADPPTGCVFHTRCPRFLG